MVADGGFTSLHPIVEGHGEIESVPLLIRRILEPSFSNVLVPVRRPRSSLVRPGELERAVELAARRSTGAILVLIDADDDCPATLGPDLTLRAQQARSDRLVSVVLANREFESWLIAGVNALRGSYGLPTDLETPPNVEMIRGAKEWLTDHMEGSRAYSETVDQVSLTARFDMEAARSLDSFDKFCREVNRLYELMLARSIET